MTVHAAEAEDFLSRVCDISFIDVFTICAFNVIGQILVCPLPHNLLLSAQLCFFLIAAFPEWPFLVPMWCGSHFPLKLWGQRLTSLPVCRQMPHSQSPHSQGTVGKVEIRSQALSRWDPRTMRTLSPWHTEHTKELWWSLQSVNIWGLGRAQGP